MSSVGLVGVRVTGSASFLARLAMKQSYELWVSPTWWKQYPDLRVWAQTHENEVPEVPTNSLHNSLFPLNKTLINGLSYFVRLRRPFNQNTVFAMMNPTLVTEEGSSVGIATDCTAAELALSTPALGPIEWGTSGTFPRVERSGGVKLAMHLRLVPRMSIRGSIHSLLSTLSSRNA
jgi:hypothetical protein